MRMLRSILVAGAVLLPFASHAQTLGPTPVSTAVGTFSPTFDFVTHGDLSVSYASQKGYYNCVNGIVYINVALTFTPTYTTASGNGEITGLPLSPEVANYQSQGAAWFANVTLGTNLSATPTVNAAGAIIFRQNVSASASTPLTATAFPSATSNEAINMTMVYKTASGQCS